MAAFAIVAAVLARRIAPAPAVVAAAAVWLAVALLLYRVGSRLPRVSRRG